MNFEKLIKAKQGSNNYENDNDIIGVINNNTNEPKQPIESINRETSIIKQQPDTEINEIDNNTELGNNNEQPMYADLDLNTKIQRDQSDRYNPDDKMKDGIITKGNAGQLKNFNELCSKYVAFKKDLIKKDIHYLRNIQLEYKYHLTMLETYLKAKGYKYLFVDFQKYYYPENFVSFSYTKNETSHPTAEDCTKYANFIYNKLTNE